MIQTNSDRWQKKGTVIKGNLGEKIIREYLENKGWIVYGVETPGGHAFDKLCIKDKKSIIIAEIKTKARMNKYPATGFNYNDYLIYHNIYNKYKIEIFIFFVDEGLSQIYGNKLSILEGEYKENGILYPFTIQTYNGGKIILFPLSKMKIVRNLSRVEVDELKLLSHRNYKYQFER